MTDITLQDITLRDVTYAARHRIAPTDIGMGVDVDAIEVAHSDQPRRRDT